MTNSKPHIRQQSAAERTLAHCRKVAACDMTPATEHCIHANAVLHNSLLLYALGASKTAAYHIDGSVLLAPAAPPVHEQSCLLQVHVLRDVSIE